MSIPNELIPFLPPIRLILTNKCNGFCFFCHSEGYSDGGSLVMSQTVLSACINAANRVGIKKFVLTGGEPTLVDSLSDICRYIYKNTDDAATSIVTNGYRILELLDSLLPYIDGVSLSVSSFDKSIYDKYTKVDPIPIINKLSKTNIHKKAVNIVVTDDNAKEVPYIIKYCIDIGVSVKIMSPIQKEYKSVAAMSSVAKMLDRKIKFEIVQLGYTPALVANVDDNTTITIKKPRYSKLLRWNTCKDCRKWRECSEAVCGVRVSPTGKVFSCINHCQNEIESDTEDSIVTVYQNLVGDKRYANELFI